MSLILVPLLLLAALAGAWLVWRSRSAARPVAPPGRPLRTPVPAAPAVADQPLEPARAPAPAEFFTTVPEPLASLQWPLADTLPAAPRQALVAALGRIPRPPAALHQLLSPAFLERANSNALSDLINGEAQIAAKVLATVNAPFHGLQRPVSGIGQAVTFLGLNTVRSICLKGLLDDSFPSTHPALKQACREIWDASALASELCNRLSAKLGLADAGALVAQVLLSFLGHLATASLLVELPARPAGPAPRLAGGSLRERSHQAQALLGLGPAEIGGLLLQAWGLPAPIVDAVRAIDRLLVTPADSLAPADSQRLALAHLCARLGEHLAAGGPASAASLAGLAAGLAESDDSFHLRAHLATPALARLPEHLQAADLAQALLNLQQGMQGQRRALVAEPA